MNRRSANRISAPCDAHAGIRTLVISQHDAVRRELVLYLRHAPELDVSGDVFSPESIVGTRPAVLILDLGQLDRVDVRRAIDAARRAGASLIALASMWEPSAEHDVTEAGGLYQLKSAGADGLVETVLAMAADAALSQIQAAEPFPHIDPTPTGRPPRTSRAPTAAPRVKPGHVVT
jgi:DNA-binding NarL/FixJ family response regulator